MNEQQAIRKRLESRLAQLEEHVQKIERDRRRETNTLDRDWQEQAPVRQNDEVLDSLEEEELQQLTAIRAALKRMDDGTYGICVSCEEPIAPKRLEALPHAVLCIACATEAEGKGGQRR